MALTTPSARRLRTLIEFTATRLTPENIETVGRRLGNFLLAAPGGQPGSDTGGVYFGSSSLPTPTPGDVEDVQRRLSALLAVAAGKRVQLDNHGDDAGAVDKFGKAVRTQDLVADYSVMPDWLSRMLVVEPVRLTPSRAADGSVTLTADGSFPDRFVTAAMFLLAQAGTESIRICPICGRLFPKEGKRQHCNRARCKKEFKQRAYQRWYAGPKGEAYYREKHHWNTGGQRNHQQVQKKGER